ncbi:MAG: C10 family peptidase [Parabacteroides sp.]
MRLNWTYLFQVILFLAVAPVASAQWIAPQEAQQRAAEFLAGRQELRTAISASELELLFTVTDTTQLDAGAASSLRAASAEAEEALFYAFGRKSGGFVIASADERAYPVLGYDLVHTLLPDDLPDSFRDWLRQYAVQIAQARTKQPVTPSGSLRSSSTSYDSSWQKIAPLITSEWNQSAPYNGRMPEEQGKRCLTGCPTTVMAQLMDYYRYQNWKVSRESWTSGSEGESSYLHRTINVQFTDSVNWNLQKRNYETESYTETEAAEVAKLMEYAGAAMHTSYGLSVSGINAWDVLQHMYRVADYGPHASFRQLWQHTLEEWHSMLYQQLAAKRPVPYASLGGGHIFLLDGYDGEGYFHINWGWGGYANGQFLLSALLPEQEMHLHQVGIFDCCPATMEPLLHESLLFDDITLNAQGNRSTLNVVLSSLNPQPQQGELCLALYSYGAKQPILTDPVSFSFTPDKNYQSDTIRVPFPQYTQLTADYYMLVVWQLFDEDLAEISVLSTLEWNPYLVKGKTGYERYWLPSSVAMSITDHPLQLFTRSCDTLSLKLTNYTIGMPTLDFRPILFNETDTFTLAATTLLVSDGSCEVKLPVQVPDKAIPGQTYQLYVENDTYEYSDTVQVTIARGPELVLTQVPQIPDTLYVGENHVFTFRVKNAGTKPFQGNLSMGVDQGDGTPYYIRPQEGTLAVGAELTYTGGVQASAALPVRLFVAQDKNWQLNMSSGEPFERKVVFVERPTSVASVEASALTLQWQGSQLAIRSDKPLHQFQVYDWQGRTVASGPLQGTEARIDASTWPAGIYVVAIETADGKTEVYKIRL